MMKMQDRLRENQPVVYQTLRHALSRQKLSHALLLCGPRGTERRETAIFIAQSLVCQHSEEGLACEECESCQRIAQGQYADLIVLDGADRSIKKDEILSLQEQFSKTALEGSGKKIYILDHAENATPEALNSLLKFLEEPQGSDTQAILIVENPDRLLPTVVSRCQQLPFRPLTQKQAQEMAKQAGLDETDCLLLSHLIRDPQRIQQAAEEESYQNGVQMMKRFVQEFTDHDQEVLLWIHGEYLTGKEKEKDRRTFRWFLDCLLVFYRLAAAKQTQGPPWFQQHIAAVQSSSLRLDKLILTLLECRDKLQRSYNLPLLADQLIYQMKEGLRDE